MGGEGVVVYSSIDNGYVVCVDMCVEEREISTKGEGLGKGQRGGGRRF